MDADIALARASPDIDEMSKPSLKGTKNEPPLRKVICRYGSGCTHMLDPSHREKFWHPKVHKVNEEKLKNQYVCNECAYSTASLPDLVLHLKRKTAWSNNSLVGCRVNCLLDYKEWQEGFVTQFHKSGKHLVEFRNLSDKRWLVMKKAAFYIIERPAARDITGEFKDSEGNGQTAGAGGVLAGGDLAPVEDWVYVEDITPEYAYAQSVLFKVYGNVLQETGHLTRGHVCLTESDKHSAQQIKSSLLYGELLPRGANKALGKGRLEAYRGGVLCDLGMGVGKICVQAFLQYPSLTRVVGVELSAARYKLAEDAVWKMVELTGSDKYRVEHVPGHSITVIETCDEANPSNPNVDPTRTLMLHCGNIFDLPALTQVDICMMETDIPMDCYPQLRQLLGSLAEGARVLSYLDLKKVYDPAPLPFRQLEVNRVLSDRYPTSWSVQRGHHFYLWVKIPASESAWSAGRSSKQGSDSPAHPNATPVDSSAFAGATGVQSGGASSRCLPFGLRFSWSTNSNASNNVSYNHNGSGSSSGHGGNGTSSSSSAKKASAPAGVAGASGKGTRDESSAGVGDRSVIPFNANTSNTNINIIINNNNNNTNINNTNNNNTNGIVNGNSSASSPSQGSRSSSPSPLSPSGVGAGSTIVPPLQLASPSHLLAPPSSDEGLASSAGSGGTSSHGGFAEDIRTRIASPSSSSSPRPTGAEGSSSSGGTSSRRSSPRRERSSSPRSRRHRRERDRDRDREKDGDTGIVREGPGQDEGTVREGPPVAYTAACPARDGEGACVCLEEGSVCGVCVCAKDQAPSLSSSLRRPSSSPASPAPCAASSPSSRVSMSMSPSSSPAAPPSPQMSPAHSSPGATGVAGAGSSRGGGTGGAGRRVVPSDSSCSIC